MTTLGIIGAIGGGIVGWVMGGPMGALYGVSIGFGIGMALDPIRPDGETPGKPQVGQFVITTAAEGVVISDFLGTTKLTGNIIQYGNNRNVEVVETQEAPSGGKGGMSGGGGGSQSYVSGYKYYLTWGMGLGAGEIDMLYTIYAGDTVVWSGRLGKPDSSGEETITLTDMGSMTLYFGTEDQIANSVLGALLPDPTLNPAYRGLAYAVFNDCLIGDYNRAPVMRFVARKAPLYDWTDREIIETFYYNPACAIFYVLTEKIGMDAEYIDTTGSLAEAAERLYEEGRGITLLMDKQQEAITYIGTILDHIDATLFWGSDAKLHLKLIRDDEEVENLPVVDQDMMLDDFSMTRKSWLDTLNEIKVKYPLLYTSEEECECPSDPAFSVDEETTPETIDPDGTVIVAVLNGCPPFTWEVTYGTGYWFRNSPTMDRNNILHCIDGECGDFSPYVEFTVTDNCGTIVTKFIRNTAGHWEPHGELFASGGAGLFKEAMPTCPLHLGGWTGDDVLDFEYIYQHAFSLYRIYCSGAYWTSEFINPKSYDTSLYDYVAPYEGSYWYNADGWQCSAVWYPEMAEKWVSPGKSWTIIQENAASLSGYGHIEPGGCIYLTEGWSFPRGYSDFDDHLPCEFAVWEC